MFSLERHLFILNYRQECPINTVLELGGCDGGNDIKNRLLAEMAWLGDNE
jgi:hypothetical protein